MIKAINLINFFFNMPFIKTTLSTPYYNYILMSSARFKTIKYVNVLMLTTNYGKYLNS